MATLEYPKVRRAGTWFDVRRRQLGMWAYALNRITGIGLVAYLYIHLVVLSMLSGGPSSWDSFVAIARTPLFLSLDVILLAGMLIHGLNGLRVTVTGLGVAVSAQKTLFVGLMIVAVVALGAAILKIFGG
jgi:succinate dehydrogenase / fumarate reductase cytochrome b subunit